MTHSSTVHISTRFKTKIDSLGEANISSELLGNFINEDEDAYVALDRDFLGNDPQNDGVHIIKVSAAGPRKKTFFDPSKSKFAIVTCGGLCPGINDVIRAIVMEACHIYKVPNVLGVRYGLEGFIPSFKHEFKELTPKSTAHIHQFGGTILGSSRGPQEPIEVVNTLERQNINALFMIGGDGTMKATSAVANEIAKRNLKISIIGIPKTIDNDINFIAQSFGFETAVAKASESISCAHTEALGARNGIGLVKLMGRESGFIAAQSTLANKEVNFVLIPEINFKLDGQGGLLPALYERLLNRKHAVIVVAEGAGQSLLVNKGETDASGNIILADIAGLLQKEIKNYLQAKGMEYSLKFIDPSYIIRSVTASANDKVYCTILGQNAVHAAMAGYTNMVVAKLMGKYVHLPLSLVTEKRRTLNTRSEYWRSVLESTGQTELSGMLPG